MTTISPEQTVVLDARWMHNGEVLDGDATIEFQRWTPDGSEWWDPTVGAWGPQASPQPMEWDDETATHRYALTVPALWMGQMVRYICRHPGQNALLDNLRCDATVASRASDSAVTGGDIGRVR
jgi:hypothetical protein